MNPKEIKALVKALREAGVSYYKSADIELKLGEVQAEAKRQVPIDAPIAADDPIKHKIEEMVSIMKLSENDLVERLFPDTEPAVDNGVH